MLAACQPAEPLNPASGATCLVGAADCEDGSFGHAATEDDARALLGVRRDDLPDDDVVGRLTVEIDGGVVTSVRLEGEDGPITVE